MTPARQQRQGEEIAEKIYRVLPVWQYVMGLVTAVSMFLMGLGVQWQKLQSMQESIVNLTIASRAWEIQQARQDRINAETRDWLIRHDREFERQDQELRRLTSRR